MGADSRAAKRIEIEFGSICYAYQFVFPLAAISC